MLKLFNRFPRELATPERFLVKSQKDFLDYIAKANGKKRIFTSVYEFNPDTRLVSLDKIFFDFDSEAGLKNLVKMHDYCKAKNYRHIMFFSGNGFHLYILTKNYETLQNPKQCLFNSHMYLATTQNGLKFGIPEKSDLDRTIRGDIRQNVTVPGTWNNKRERFCICVTEEDLAKGYDTIKNKAKEQNFIWTYYGTDYFDVKPFDKAMDEYSTPLIVKAENLKKIEKSEAMNNMLPCIKAWLTDEYVGWDRRGKIIMWLRDKGIWRKKLNEGFPCLYEETLDVLKEVFSPSEFEYMLSKRNANQPHYLYFRNRNNSFPSCNTLKGLGECPSTCFCLERKKFEVRR